MKKIFPIIIFGLSLAAKAQIGQPWIHDPSTIAECDGKYYTFGTGGGGLISDDGWSWHSGGVRPGGGAAPDVIKINGRYLVIYGATGGGLGGGHNGRILTMWNKTLDPSSPDFRYTEPVEVASSDGLEDNDAIDPGVLLDPTDGRMWVSYGTYFGNIRLIELDPKTGCRMKGNKAVDVAIDCEATDLIYRDGYYYLLGTHGTCCDGVNSTYNIVCGRSRKVTGPYIDNVGRSMMEGGGKMVAGAEPRRVGAGHFGRTVIDDGVEVASFHYEADFDRSGHSVLAVRPLLWRNGWPEVGHQFRDGTYSILSCRRGYALELAVDFVRIEQKNRMGWHNIDAEKPLERIPDQTLDEVKATWPSGETGVRAGDNMFRPHQLWSIKAVPEAGGYLSNPYFSITVAGTGRALCATADMEVVSSPLFTGDDCQLWRIEQLTDGSFRIMPKAIPGKEGLNTEYVLYSIGDSTPTLAPYDFDNDNSKWTFLGQ
ncbi:family 43 glycosylhydrolase [Xylanibacter muris]|uniref:Family 43 glycosylhydrolase n=1 Tax=Xylanibacter muris TaxID=2736290 RepID=A0ABX2AKF0_9BACT|nr:family 43 glycosylhydrolase [Xylanibacter muris]NPD91022.1 family 43 glycosylhydrolase [Xylanibacter muris]